MQEKEPLRLNIGGGAVEIPGFQTIDRKNGFEAYPLRRSHERTGDGMFPDDSVEEIRACHVLEHFGHQEAELALREWVRVLKPGGTIKVAVPDFAFCAKAYLDGRKMPIAGFVMGGQTDKDDFHRTLFDEEHLRRLMEGAGLTDIQHWTDDIDDCHRSPCSLNLMGTKGGTAAALALPYPEHRKISAVISLPRFGPTAHSNFMYRALGPLGIPVEMQWGCFWEQRLTAAMENLLDNGTEWVLTMDYDTAFSIEDVKALAALMEAHPEADAIAPIQTKREEPTALFRPIDPATGKYKTGEVDLSDFDGDLTEVGWAHFGLTLIRVSALKKMKRPWFLGVPDAKGSWSDHATHPDIYFWDNLRASGCRLFVANHVAIGHMQWVNTWPTQDLDGVMFQYVGDYQKRGKPAEARR
jgi:predicted SAM-dependent methyltransferase